MKGFLYVLQKDSIEHDSNLVTSKINELKQTNHFFEFRENERLKCYFYTNEPNVSLKPINNSKFITPIGQYVKNIKKITKDLANLEDFEIRNYVSELRGAFAIGLADFVKNEVRLLTHIFRIDNIFYIENKEHIVVGTDPLIVSAISNSKNLTPEVEIKNCVSFLMNGFFADEKTLFKGVEVMPANSEIIINDEGILIRPIDNSLDKISSLNLTEEHIENLEVDYIKAFKAIPENKSIDIGITGGKDSRLALLGLLNSGYKVKTNTRGFKDNPDVIMGEKIAKHLGLDHKINQARIMSEKGLTINLEEKTLDSMIATSGQVYGYEAIKHNPSFKGDIGVTGVAALSMKGGYSNLNGINTKKPENEMVKRFLPLDNLLLKDASKEYREFLERLGSNGFQNAQYKHALLYRNGRWTSGTRLAKSYSSDIYSPYYDNQFTKMIIKIDKENLDNGLVQHLLTKKLDKDIADLPIVGTRWGFEKEGPINPGDYENWIGRKPIYPSTKLSNYNWRDLSLKENSIVRDKFKEILLSNPRHQIFEIINYDELKNLFEKGLSKKHLKFMWSALSLYSFINYLDGERIKTIDINIKIPETIIEKVNIVPETIDLSNEIKTINNSLIISKSNNTSVVSVNDKINKNRYLTTFNENITSGINKIEANISNRKKISFNMFIESSVPISFKYCIILFKNSEKIETKWFTSTINKLNSNLRGTMDINSKANNYKLAFRVPKTLNGKFIIKYCYVELQ